MLAEYLKYWGLQKPPFSLTPDPEMLYMSRQHQEALIRLKYAVVSNKGGALLVSENAGDGKTSLLAKLRQELEGRYQDRCRTVFIDHPTLTANQMVGEIVRQLGLPVQTNDKLALLNELRPFLLERHREGEQCVVILDEGQMLCHRPDLLQELRILLNFCVSDSFLLTFILSGQKPLDEAIRAMPEFYQRLPVRFFLRNLSRDETRELIRHRLRVAGADPRQEIFSEDGYTGLYNFSQGCPRVICSVADLALVIAHTRYSRCVDFVSVSQACSDMSRTEGGYHYYYFLESFKPDSAAAMEAPPPEAIIAPAPLEPARPETAAAADQDPPAERGSVLPTPEMASPEPAPTAPAPLPEQAPAAVSDPGLAEEPDRQPEAAPGAPDREGNRLRFVLGEPEAGDLVKCGFCGLVLEYGTRECPNCGEALEVREDPPAMQREDRPDPAALPPAAATGAAAGDSPRDDGPQLVPRERPGALELELLRQAERLGLKRCIPNENFLRQGLPPERPDEELLVFPLRRWLGSSAVLCFRNGQDGYTTRCGLVFTGGALRLVLADRREELPYATMRVVELEPVGSNGAPPVLYHLRLETAGGVFRIMLPLRAAVARPLGRVLRAYLMARAGLAATGARAENPSQEQR